LYIDQLFLRKCSRHGNAHLLPMSSATLKPLVELPARLFFFFALPDIFVCCPLNTWYLAALQNVRLTKSADKTSRIFLAQSRGGFELSSVRGQATKDENVCAHAHSGNYFKRGSSYGGSWRIMSGFGGFSFSSFTSKLQEAGEKVCDPYLMQCNAAVSICLRDFWSFGHRLSERIRSKFESKSLLVKVCRVLCIARRVRMCLHRCRFLVCLYDL